MLWINFTTPRPRTVDSLFFWGEGSLQSVSVMVSDISPLTHLSSCHGMVKVHLEEKFSTKKLCRSAEQSHSFGTGFLGTRLSRHRSRGLLATFLSCRKIFEPFFRIDVVFFRFHFRGWCLRFLCGRAFTVGCPTFVSCRFLFRIFLDSV